MDLVFFAIPSQYMRGVLASMGSRISNSATLVSTTKGIENNSLALPSGMIADTMTPEVLQRACYLSGPTFARELVAKQPTAATIASLDYDSARLAQEALSSPFFRLYVHHDVIGVEIGGSVKNIIAIAAGISDGLGFGHNTRAALITRGLMEMTRLGVAMGAEAKTFTGLSGLGDLVLTCAGDLSRNRSVGLRLGKGEILKQILDSMNAVAEGVATTLSVQKLAERHGVDMPIVSEVYKVIHEGKNAKQAVSDLMNRTLKSEFY
jgi:glycerol-3-phosphate dehydrogenase (NAD(P)+)